MDDQLTITPQHDANGLFTTSASWFYGRRTLKSKEITLSTSDATAQLIISVAIREIRRVGYQNISLREVAARAGMTTGAVYRRFSGKDELLAAAAARVDEQVAKEAEDPIHDLDSPALEVMVSIVEVLLDRFEWDGRLMSFLFSDLTFAPYWQGVNTPECQAPLLKLAQMALNRVIGEDADPQTQRDTLLKCSAFVNGYGSLIANGSVPYERQVVTDALRVLTEPVPRSPEVSAPAMLTDYNSPTA